VENGKFKFNSSDIEVNKVIKNMKNMKSTGSGNINLKFITIAEERSQH
jgi:hypothetical protein